MTDPFFILRPSGLLPVLLTAFLLCPLFPAQAGEDLLDGSSREAFVRSSGEILSRLPDLQKPAFVTAVQQINIALGIRAGEIAYERGSDRDAEFAQLLRENVHGKNAGEAVAYARQCVTQRREYSQTRMAKLADLARRLDPAADPAVIKRTESGCQDAVYEVLNRLEGSHLASLDVLLSYNPPGGDQKIRKEWRITCPVTGPMPGKGERTTVRCPYSGDFAALCQKAGLPDGLPGFREVYLDGSFELAEYQQGFVSGRTLKQNMEVLQRDLELTGKILEQLGAE